MTYIAGLRSSDGFVVAADSLQTFGDGQTTLVEKLVQEAAGSYSLVIGGAGNGVLIDGFVQQVLQQIRKGNPQDDAALEGIISAALRGFYKTDVIHVPDDEKLVQFIVGAWHTEAKAWNLWSTAGPRVFSVVDHVVIGCETTFGWHHMRGHYQPGLPLNRLVSLGIYLVAVAKDSFGSAVGGPTRVIIGSPTGISEIEAAEIDLIQERVTRITKASAQFMLAAADLSLTEMQFQTERSTLIGTIGDVRSCHSEREAQRAVLEQVNDPFPRLPLGSVINVDGRGTTWAESSEKMLEKLKKRDEESGN